MRMSSSSSKRLVGTWIARLLIWTSFSYICNGALENYIALTPSAVKEVESDIGKLQDGTAKNEKGFVTVRYLPDQAPRENLRMVTEIPERLKHYMAVHRGEEEKHYEAVEEEYNRNKKLQVGTKKFQVATDIHNGFREFMHLGRDTVIYDLFLETMTESGGALYHYAKKYENTIIPTYEVFFFVIEGKHEAGSGGGESKKMSTKQVEVEAGTSGGGGERKKYPCDEAFKDLLNYERTEQAMYYSTPECTLGIVVFYYSPAKNSHIVDVVGHALNFSLRAGETSQCIAKYIF